MLFISKGNLLVNSLYLCIPLLCLTPCVFIIQCNHAIVLRHLFDSFGFISRFGVVLGIIISHILYFFRQYRLRMKMHTSHNLLG